MWIKKIMGIETRIKADVYGGRVLINFDKKRPIIVRATIYDKSKPDKPLEPEIFSRAIKIALELGEEVHIATDPEEPTSSLFTINANGAGKRQNNFDAKIVLDSTLASNVAEIIKRARAFGVPHSIPLILHFDHNTEFKMDEKGRLTTDSKSQRAQSIQEIAEWKEAQP